MIRRRPAEPARPWLAARGLIAVVAAGVVAAVLVARASGNLDATQDVFVGVPVSAGLITTQAPVRYHGVNVGRIAAIESGTQTSTVRLAIDTDALALIPDSVTARIVPRTFFGDIYLQLADTAGSSARPLTAGSRIGIDNSADAMALYDVFRKIVDVFSQLRPERMQTALTALSQALRNRGTEIGSTIDDLSDVAGALTPSAVRFLDSTPQFRDVMVALHTATPDILTTLSAATAVSHRMVDDANAVTRMVDAAAGLGSILASFLADHRAQLITVADAGGKILATTAAQPQGLLDTLSGARTFGAAGGRAFASGRFSITAVATFAGPMPYSAADCPMYGTLFGAHCQDSDPRNPVPTTPDDVTAMRNQPSPLPLARIPAVNLPAPTAPPAPAPEAEVPAAPGSYPAEVAPASAIVGGAGEAHALSVLQDHVTGHSGGDTVNIATVVMLGPLVRGSEVRVS